MNNNGSMDQCVIYARKSSEDKDRQILSLDDQLYEAKRIIKDRGLKLVAKPFVEEKTGKESGVRKAFYDLLNLIEQGKANTIICWKADRLARNGGDGGRIIELIDKGKLKVITAFGEYDKQNSIMLWVDFGFSTKYSKDLSDNVKRALKRKAEKGIRPGIAPIGYMNTPYKLKGEREIIPDPDRFKLTRKWWDLMLTGNYSVEASLNIIAKEGLTDHLGHKPHVKLGNRMFRNIFYTGSFDYGGVRYQGIHKPMVTLSEFVRVQKILDAKGDHGRKGSVLPFQGIIRCGECGSCITGERHSRGDKINNYYRCTKKKGICHQEYIRSEELENQIKDFVASMKLDPVFSEWIQKVLKRRNQQEFESSKKSKELITKQLIKIDEQKEIICKMRIDNLIDENTYKRRSKELLSKEAELSQELSNETSERWMRVMDAAIDFGANVVKLFETGDVVTKQIILRILGSNITLKNKKLEITPKSAFLFLNEAQKGYFQEIDSLEQQKIPNLSHKANVATNNINSVLRG